MIVTTRSIFLLLCSLQFRAANSLVPVGLGGATASLSSGGCACKSACETSWLQPGNLWCYVDAGCKKDGWDLCMPRATQNLYMSALTAKAAAEQKITQEKSRFEDASEHESRLRTELKDAKRKLEETKQYLKVAESETEGLRKQALELEKAAERDKAAIKQTFQNQLTLSAQNLTHVTQARSAELTALQAQLKEAKGVQVKMQLRLQAEEEKTKDAEQRLAKAEEKRRQVEKSLAETKELERKAEMATKDVQIKLANAVAKQSDTEKKLEDAKAAQKHDALLNSVRLHDANLKQEVTEKQLKQSHAVLKEAEKQLVAAREEISNDHRNNTALEHELEKEKLVAATFETELREVEQKHKDTKKKLKTSEKKRKAAEINTNIFKVVAYAHAYKQARLRGQQPEVKPTQAPRPKIMQWLHDNHWGVKDGKDTTTKK